MGESITVKYKGRSYTRSGESWFDKDFMAPSQAEINELNKLAADQIHAEDLIISNPQELLDRAKKARNTGQLSRARKLAERAYGILPSNGAAAVCSSILRDLRLPGEALAITDRHRNSCYLPILTSRAAALCDLDRWEEAYRQINQVIAMSNGDSGHEALNVRSRIKEAHPELFDS